MRKILEKKLWKDIIILVILVGVTFLRYTYFKEIKPIRVTYYWITRAALIYGYIYAVYNCKNNKERKWFIAISSLSLLFFYNKDTLEIFSYFLVAAIFLERREKCLEYYFIFSVIVMCTCMILYFFEIIPQKDDIYRGDQIRRALGFVHPNTGFRYFFGSLMALYLLDKKKIAFNVYALSGTIPLYLLTDSRTGLICCMLFVIAANFGIIFEKQIKKINFKYWYLLVTIFSLVFMIGFRNNAEWNDLLSGRPNLLYNILVDAKWHILYGHMDFLYCDNRIIYVIVKNGITALILTNIFYYLVFKKETSVEIKIIFIMGLLYGMSENLRSIGQTIVPLVCLWSLYDHYIKNKVAENDKNSENLTNNDNN